MLQKWEFIDFVLHLIQKYFGSVMRNYSNGIYQNTHARLPSLFVYYIINAVHCGIGSDQNLLLKRIFVVKFRHAKDCFMFWHLFWNISYVYVYRSSLLACCWSCKKMTPSIYPTSRNGGGAYTDKCWCLQRSRQVSHPIEGCGLRP